MAANHSTFDIIIVGGGTAGLVLASRLSEDPSLQVIVLEAGPDLPQLPEKLSQAVLTPAASPQLHQTPIDWNLKTAPQANLDGRELVIPQGKMLGGSSGLNGLSFTSIAKVVVDGWVELGNPGWEWPAFSKSLGQTYTLAKAPPITTKPSDCRGPLQVSYADNCMDKWSKVWADTIESLGYPGAQDILTGQAAGGLMIPDTVDPAMGIRSYSANAYLSPEIRSRANLTVRTGVEVKRILIERLSQEENADVVVATGVELVDPTDGVATKLVARREVIVAAGSFGSPKILELSGIGNAQRLGETHVIVDMPGVGENLQNHTITTVSFEVTSDAPPTKDAFMRAAVKQDMQVLGDHMKEYEDHRTGMFASSGLTSAAQLPTPGLDTPEGSRELENLFAATGSAHDGSFAAAHEKFVQNILLSQSQASGYYVFGPAQVAWNPDGTSAPPPMDGSEESYITVMLVLAHPLSRGSVHVTGAGADQTLAIDPGYLSHPFDLEVMARHVQFIERTLIATEPLARLVKPNGKRAVGAPKAGALKDLDVAKKLVKDRVVGASHFTGTCSMLPRKMGGVVDPSLRVYGTKNLRVCDASVIPLTPRANPQATLYAIAEHASKIIKASLFSH